LDLGVSRLFIIDSDEARARWLWERLTRRFGTDRATIASDAATAAAASDGLVNATPVGMVGHPGLPISADLIRPSMWIAEIVYFPIETALLHAARAKGCLTMSGGGMAVFQAVRSFELFVGMPAHEETMRAAFAAHTAPTL
jgi:shikimate dehydrogenase